MNSNRIEKLGVAAAVDFFCRMGHIDPHINFDDKIAVWDGNIDVHKAADSCSKEDIEFNICVQVKSSEHKSNSFNNSVTQTINISDLQLYKSNGGTLLIKVLVNKHKAQLYFAYLGKIEINKILEKTTANQKTKEITCGKAPKEYKDLYSKLKSLHQQAIHNLITWDKLKDYKDCSFYINCGPMSKEMNPIAWLATNATDILVSLPGHYEKFYLASGPSFIFTEQDLNKSVKVNNVEYFSTVKSVTNKNGHVIRIGKFLSCQLHDFSNNDIEKAKIDINISPSSTFVDDYLKELKFLDAVITYKHFYIGDARFDIPEFAIINDKNTDIKSDIEFFEKAIRFFELTHTDPHFDYKSLSDEDYRKWVFLVRLFNGENPKLIQKFTPPFACFSIGDRKYCFAVADMKQGGYHFLDVNNCSSYRTNNKSAKRIDLPVHSYLFSRDIFPINLNYSNIVDEYQKYGADENHLSFANADVLYLIKEFDNSGNVVFLNAAQKLIEWIIANNNNKDTDAIYRLNLLQIKSRLDVDFSEEDNCFLCEVGESSNNSLKFAASVLLKEAQRAKTYYTKLSIEEKKEIDKFPIYTLYEKLITE